MVSTTACKWDTIIPFEPLWGQYERVIKDNGAIVLTASQPFTTVLIASNLRLYKYNWVWAKNKCTGFVHAKNKPLKQHEDVCVFSPGTTVHATQSPNRMTYNPQGLTEVNIQRTTKGHSDTCFSKRPSHGDFVQTHTGYPKSILSFPSDNDTVHPTQKPIALFKYLIKTYTNEGETVLDNCIGSGTTAIACINTGRSFIGIEKEQKYVEIARKRIEEHTEQLQLPL